ncbi:ABC transporter permease [Halofilum ochraceum]|uniref:ABC transporter permease n=1 Tax=Halofilum ochraceum TaxID=1611323 RepID=UPI0008D8D639|nr:ABC transporter permease [Halofilum ochraceum]
MGEFARAFVEAGNLLIALDPDILGIVALSLRVSVTAVIIGTLIALPLGATLALARFRGRGIPITILNAFMGLPPVVVGLAVYLLLSRAGPLGQFGLLFTPGAMVIAQAILVLPLIAALTRQTIEDLAAEYREDLAALGANRLRMLPTLLWEGRFSLTTGVLAGFGRAIAEVGAVFIVGGNIDGVTRVMTTAITLETSKGNLGMALGLGIILIALTIGINGIAMTVSRFGRMRYGV